MLQEKNFAEAERLQHGINYKIFIKKYNDTVCNSLYTSLT